MGLWTTENMAKSDNPFLDRLERCVWVGSVHSMARASKMTPEQLASRWNIGLDKAKKTLAVTTQ
jgi:hypothetical protein